MKRLLLISTIIIVFGLSLFTVGFALSGFDIKELSTRSDLDKKTYIVENDIKSIVINDNFMNINIIRSADDKIKVEYYENDKEKYSIKEDLNENQLNIIKTTDYKWYNYSFMFNITKYYLTLYIPEKYMGSLNAYTYNGNINVTSLDLNDIKLETKNGDITVSFVDSINNIDINSKNGEIELNSITCEKDVNVETYNGEIEIESLKANSLNTKTKNGEIGVKNTQVENNAYMKSINGEIDAEWISFKNECYMETKNGDIEGAFLGNIREYSIDASTKIGNSNISSYYAEGLPKITAITKCGDIEIDFNNM